MVMVTASRVLHTSIDLLHADAAATATAHNKNNAAFPLLPMQKSQQRANETASMRGRFFPRKLFSERMHFILPRITDSDPGNHVNIRDLTEAYATAGALKSTSVGSKQMGRRQQSHNMLALQHEPSSLCC